MLKMSQRIRSTLLILINAAHDGLRFLRQMACSHSALAAENLFLRKQLAFYQEHKIRPRRLSNAARFSLLLWSRLFDWQAALAIVKPDTFLRWQREAYKRFWKWKSRAGRPRLPENIRRLIVGMVKENPTWGQARIAAELSVKLGICVSPRTVRAYWPEEPGRQGPRRTSSQHWRTFVHNHAQAIVASDFLIAITARFQILYVLLIMEIGSRRILHCNVTPHPTAEWTLQQFREAVPSDHSYRYLIHDRDSIFSAELDDALRGFGLKILRTPVRAPTANAYCERLVGTVRRECLDFIIPLDEKHLRKLLTDWVIHYNQGRPHSSLGPGIPDPQKLMPQARDRRHQLPADCRIRSKDVLGGLHHEYWLEKVAA